MAPATASLLLLKCVLVLWLPAFPHALCGDELGNTGSLEGQPGAPGAGPRRAPHAAGGPLYDLQEGDKYRHSELFQRLSEEAGSADEPEKRYALLGKPAKTIASYLRYLDSRLLALDMFAVDYADPVLQSDLAKMSCLSMALLATPSMQATAVVFPNGFLGRLAADLTSLDFGESCAGSIQPFAFHQHERAQDLPLRGTLNDRGACEAAKTGGHHDPGFACGPTGSSECPQLPIPPSSSLRGTPLFTGKYNCTPEVYRTNPFACHAGDYSGKYGEGFDASLDPSRADIRVIARDTHADNPCVAADRRQSLVIHCHSTNKRIACAPFERVEAGGPLLSRKLHHLIATFSVVVSSAMPDAPPAAPQPPAPEPEAEPAPEGQAAERAEQPAGDTEQQLQNVVATLALIEQIEQRLKALENAAARQQKVT